MKLIFGAAPTLGSWLIRFFTFSRWSHVGVVYGYEVIEAHFPRVRSVPLSEFKASYPRNEFAELACDNEHIAEAWVRSRIGNLYDLGGLIAIPFLRGDWQSNSRDFCSELPITAAAMAGTEYVRDVHRVTPEMLYELTKALK